MMSGQGKEGSMDNLILLPLHERKDLLDACVDLLNSQWPRSKTARLRSLEQSFWAGEFPISLLLLEMTYDKEGNKKERLVGHSRISPVADDNLKCFVESVVICKEMRGKGYGRRIMDLTEDYAKRMGIKVMHLTTLDQQGFYGKLGYEFCNPILAFSGSSPNIQKVLLAAMMHSNEVSKPFSIQDPAKGVENNLNDNAPKGSGRPEVLSSSMKNMSLARNNSAPPPPPPPAPRLPSQNSQDRVQILSRPDGSPQTASNGLKMHMRKVLI